MATRNGTPARSRLRQVASRPERPAVAEQEHCDLCSAPIPAEHRHLLDVDSRELMCACQACRILFDSPAAAGAGGGHYRLVGDRRRQLTDFRIDERTWAELRIPVEMAFFFYSTPAERVVAFYPSPAGATESLLELDAWEELVSANPVLGSLDRDVEALLVNRARGKSDYFLVPIDDCYSLVGLIRTTWRGLSGGSEVWKQIEQFFERLQGRCKPVSINTEEEPWQTSRPATAT